MERKINDYSDNELILLFQGGSNLALSSLVNRYKERIFSSVLYLVKDRTLAEDIFQDTFIKIIETLRTKNYNEEGKFLPWALRIAHNLCVDHFRKIKRRPAVVTTDATEVRDVFEILGIGTDDNAEQRMMKEQSYASIHKMLDYLPKEQKEVVVLRHFGDLSFKEIAEITDCSINTALGRMRYGLMNLRKMVVEYDIAL